MIHTHFHVVQNLQGVEAGDGQNQNICPNHQTKFKRAKSKIWQN